MCGGGGRGVWECDFVMVPIVCMGVFHKSRWCLCGAMVWKGTWDNRAPSGCRRCVWAGGSSAAAHFMAPMISLPEDLHLLSRGLTWPCTAARRAVAMHCKIQCCRFNAASFGELSSSRPLKVALFCCHTLCKVGWPLCTVAAFARSPGGSTMRSARVVRALG